MLFSEPKIPQSTSIRRDDRTRQVSVLFSEPKIPQCTAHHRRFSARRVFQCSSASRKFLNRLLHPTLKDRLARFSALQRAENSSMAAGAAVAIAAPAGFSALQRAENSSIPTPLPVPPRRTRVSVLFSEPKIPQYEMRGIIFRVFRSFSALQRAENSSIALLAALRLRIEEFQCSSASRKFLNRERNSGRNTIRRAFQCSSASRKFLNVSTLDRLTAASRVSVLFSEPKIPQCRASS